jgi:hypothetical protein
MFIILFQTVTKKLDVGTDTIIGRLKLAFSNAGGSQFMCRNTPVGVSVGYQFLQLRGFYVRRLVDADFFIFVPYKFSVLNFWRSYEDQWEM